MSDQLENLVNQASEAASNFSPPATVSAPQGGTVAAYQKPSMDSFLDGGGLDVDVFIRLNDSGIRFGDKMQGLVDEFTADLDMSLVTPISSFRYEVGGQTTFIKSYDGVTASDGRNFAQACAQAERIPGAKCSGVYPTVEIPMTLVEAVKDPKAGSNVKFEAGTTVGYTPSVTGAKYFQALGKKLRDEDPTLLKQTIRVKCTHLRRTKGTNNWGVIEFERIAA